MRFLFVTFVAALAATTLARDSREDRSSSREKRRHSGEDDRRSSKEDEPRSQEVPPMSPLANEIEKMNQADMESMERADSRERRLLDQIEPLGEVPSSRERSDSKPRSDEDRHEYDHEDSAHPYEDPRNRNQIPPEARSVVYENSTPPNNSEERNSRENSREVPAKESSREKRDSREDDRRSPEKYEDDVPDRYANAVPKRQSTEDDNYEDNKKRLTHSREYRGPRGEETPSGGYSNNDEYSRPENEPTQNSQEKPNDDVPENDKYNDDNRGSAERPPNENHYETDINHDNVPFRQRPPNNDGHMRKRRENYTLFSTTRPPKTSAVTNRRNPRAIIPVYESFVPHRKHSSLNLGRRQRPIYREADSKDIPSSNESDYPNDGDLSDDYRDSQESPRRPSRKRYASKSNDRKKWNKPSIKPTTRKPTTTTTRVPKVLSTRRPRPIPAKFPQPSINVPKPITEASVTSATTTQRPSIRPWKWQGPSMSFDDEVLNRLPQEFGEFGARMKHFGKSAKHLKAPQANSSKAAVDAAAEASRFHGSFRLYDFPNYDVHSARRAINVSDKLQNKADNTKANRHSSPALKGHDSPKPTEIKQDSWKDWKPPSDIQQAVGSHTTATPFWKTYRSPTRVATKDDAAERQQFTHRETTSIGWLNLDPKETNLFRPPRQADLTTTTSPTIKSTKKSDNLFNYWQRPANQLSKHGIVAVMLKNPSNFVSNDFFSKGSSASQKAVDVLTKRVDESLGKNSNQTSSNIRLLKSVPILQRRSDDLDVAASQHHNENLSRKKKKHAEFDKNYDKTKNSILEDFQDMNKEKHFMPSEYIISVKYKNSTNKEAEKRLKSRGFTETHHRLVERFEIIHQHENSEEAVGTAEPKDPDQAAAEESNDRRVQAMSRDNLRQMRNGEDITANQLERPPIEVRTLLHGYGGSKPYLKVYRGNHPESVHKMPSEGFPINDSFKSWVHKNITI